MITTTIEYLVQTTLDRYNVPGMALAVGRDAMPAEYLAMGRDAEGHLLRVDDLFPVASITKLATALCVLRLVDRGQLELDDPLARWLPEAVAAQKGVTLRRLLCHTGGLPEDISGPGVEYAPGLTWEALRAACLNTLLERPPATRVVYSNAGYGLLAAVVERSTGREFGAALRSLVLEPLGIEAYLEREPPRPVVRIEDVRSSRRGTALEPFNTPFWRSLAMPWAGLVTNPAGALGLVRAFQGYPEDFLESGTRAEAVRNQVGELGGGYGGPFIYEHSPWGLGPDLRGAKNPHWAPPEAGPDCFGHAGASGAVAWVSPLHGVAWVILGARSADNGWLLRATPAIGTALLKE